MSNHLKNNSVMHFIFYFFNSRVFDKYTFIEKNIMNLSEFTEYANVWNVHKRKMRITFLILKLFQ